MLAQPTMASGAIGDMRPFRIPHSHHPARCRASASLATSRPLTEAIPTLRDALQMSLGDLGAEGGWRLHGTFGRDRDKNVPRSFYWRLSSCVSGEDSCLLRSACELWSRSKRGTTLIHGERNPKRFGSCFWELIPEGDA